MPLPDFRKPGAPRGLSAWFLALLLLTSCRFSGLSLTEDNRVEILAPKDRSEVRLPFDVRWKANQFEGSFAVFVDRAPQPPGKTIKSLFEQDEDCRRRPDCPDAAYLAAQNVYLTSDTTTRVQQVPDIEGRQFHELTIVLLDERSRRVTESAFAVEFKVPGR